MAAGLLQFRVRRWKPEAPQLRAVQLLYAVHAPHPPSTAQACVLQAVVWVLAPAHPRPPFLGVGLLQDRDRLITPPPQTFEHIPYAPQALNPPCTGAGLTTAPPHPDVVVVVVPQPEVVVVPPQPDDVVVVVVDPQPVVGAVLQGAGAVLHGAGAVLHGAGAVLHGAGAALQGAGAALHGAGAGAVLQGAGAVWHGAGAVLHGAGSGLHGLGAGAWVGQAAVPQAAVSVAAPAQVAPPLDGAGLLHARLLD